jgi:DNA-binding NarL/FixJ family response regulator
MDMFRRGRQTNTGAANPRAILTENDLSVIQRHFSQGKTYKKIAALFDVSTSCVKNVIYGKNWKNAKQEVITK